MTKQTTWSVEDLGRVHLLLRIVHDASAVGPTMSNVTAYAAAELKTINDDLGVHLAEQAKVKAAEHAKHVADTKAKAEAQAKEDHLKDQKATAVVDTAEFAPPIYPPLEPPPTEPTLVDRRV